MLLRTLNNLLIEQLPHLVRSFICNRDQLDTSDMLSEAIFQNFLDAHMDAHVDDAHVDDADTYVAACT